LSGSETGTWYVVRAIQTTSPILERHKPMAKSTKNAVQKPGPESKRPYLKQSDVPLASLDDALRVVQAIFDQSSGSRPVSPFQLAKALNLDPRGSQLKLLTGAAIAFGLIEGGAQASAISFTELARRVLRPKEENADLMAKREAILKPRVFGDFLRQYDGKPFPRQDIALNVLEDMGVPRARAAEVLERIDESARSVGFIEEIKGKNYVSLPGPAVLPGTPQGPEVEESKDDEAKDPEVPQQRVTVQPPAVQSKSTELTVAIADDQRRRRVFITHGKNRDLVDPIRKLLEYGELEAVVSVDRQSVSKPVPEKVMDDMRKAGAAIIHVDADRTIVDKDGNENVLLNPNVLIEIGAAMAFYGRRFILLVREGVIPTWCSLLLNRRCDRYRRPASHYVF
jgi:hypothetical protein